MLPFPAHAGKTQQIFDARHRIAQGAIGVVQLRGALERKLALEFRGAHEIIRVQLPGERLKPLLEVSQSKRKLSRQAEKREIICAPRQRLDLSASRAEMRAPGGPSTA